MVQRVTVPTASEPISQLKDGERPLFGKVWFKAFSDVFSRVNDLLQAQAYASTMTDERSIFIASATNGAVVVIAKLPFALTLVDISHRTQSGGCVVTARKNGVAIPGATGSVATALQTNAATGGNAFAVGDELSLLISGASSPVGLSVTFKYSRSLPA